MDPFREGTLKTYIAALVGLALAVPSVARSQPVSGVSGPDTYLELHLGAFVPQHDDLDVLDTGYAFGGTFGARFTPNLGVEGELGYVRASGTDTRAAPGTFEQTLAMVPFAASLRVTLPLRVAELSALAGGSLAVAWLESRFGGATTIQDFTRSDTTAAFGFHVGAAAAFHLSPTMLFGVNVRQTFVPAKFDGAEVNLDGLRIALTLGYHL